MRIAIASDLHLEFGPITFHNSGAEVLILAGDILVADQFNPDASKFINDVCSKFAHVIYVMGNHEHYRGNFTKTLYTIRHDYSHLANLHVLDKEAIEINGVNFVGATLWTDLFNLLPSAILACARMRDFSIIRIPDGKGGETRFDVSTMLDDHAAAKTAIERLTRATAVPNVVVTHHGVSELSCDLKFTGDSINGAFYSILDDWVKSLPNVRLLVSGHTHHVYRYYIGDTLVCCNPRGYIGHEPCANNFKLRYIELDSMPDKFTGIQYEF